MGGQAVPLVERVLLDRVVGGLKTDDSQARSALADLVDQGLIAPEPVSVQAGTLAEQQLSLTDPGRAVFDRITTAVAGIVERLYGDLPAEDQLVTQRLLATVTARANAELAGA